MAKEKKTKYVLLGFLLEKPLSGYEIGSMIRQSTNHFWQESDASIYPTLKLLKEEGLVTAETLFSGKRRKQVFTITEDGRKAFREWFERCPEPDVHREEFLLKLFFTDKKLEIQMQKHCRKKLSKMKSSLAHFKETEEMLKREHPEKKWWLQTLRFGIAHLEVDIALLQDTLGEKNG